MGKKSINININKKYFKNFISIIFKKIDSFYDDIDNVFFIIFLFIILFAYKYFSISEYATKIFINTWLLIFILYHFIINSKNLEKYIIEKINYILTISILLILVFQSKLGLDNKDTLLMIGGIVAFWYGYKKYERDKDMELYNNIVRLDKDEDNFKVMNYWYINFLQYEKGYINKDLWEIIELHFFTTYHYIFIINKNENKKQKILLIILLTLKTFKYNNYIMDYFNGLRNKLNSSNDKELIQIIEEALKTKKD